MDKVSIDELKKQIRSDDDTEDEYLSLLIDAAQSVVEKYINRPLSDYPEIPAPLKMAILLVAANLYANREPVAFAQASAVPGTYDLLIQPYIRYEGGATE